MKMPVIEFVHPDDRSMVIGFYQQRMQGGQAPSNYEFRGISKEGKVRSLEIKPVAILWQGRPAILAFLHDITEQRLLEAQLRQAQKMEAIGTLAGGIAHDFNNLLSSILGHAALMEMDDEITKRQKERLLAVEELIKSASSLTSQLLGFARMGRYEVKPTDMREILDKTAGMFGRTHKEIVIHKRYEENLLPVEADRTQMEQVFMNLFVNAWQAMPGGGTIYIGTSNMVVHGEDSRKSVMDPGAYVKISLTDTGMGMDEATKSRIFEPFFTTKEMGRGTGLGLAMVYGIVKGHDGHINVYSEKGHGTTFNIYIPASKRELIREEEKVKEELARGTETVLLVDDEKQIIEVVGEILKKLGYKVIVARTGEEAVEIYRQKKTGIDLVILDLIMPGTGGGPTYDRLREVNPDVKVILSSGYSLDGQARAVMDKGCCAFIQKPVGIRKLSGKIREVLGKA
jgi:two-component system cell cycle sensor histidine kinase/response regulator CckA